MSGRVRILITGFGPFPGAPINPTMPLVKRLAELRRPALDDADVSSHIFHVTYATVDRELPALIAERRPHALLMFGLAGRTSYLRIETRARNAITTTFPDADRRVASKGVIVPGAHPLVFGPHMARLLRAARATGIDARPSRDAGSYLCNYLSWRAIEATRDANGPRLAAFIHIPPLPRAGTVLPHGSSRMTLDALVDAGEAMLIELIRLARQETSRTSRDRSS
ncbi:Putative Pyrrolidone-carboxylate peptidase (5-oxoprolyl-peptidase) (Pyroglutamyl-peptidase I) (PGP-I) (Pyrase) [Bradyrhizobium sp. ORS 278]|uniref:pyroglutamyl-peptidase I n=1 Tax=Bradyrhizobium sp. (strain ORS 278) TaxID=114615 RepID=UPI000150831A|nr:pyroglutamyl-peptidase I [Bradyrhizobium sp. ORS 278]CAL76492.1 Putative Pyrrolidone-carboxylate peptidase (5-oxoprolyl-peptidase) (Pyroglutamyl-peptidase I) (PGP-I) (Pyrase) [Bradyrhizobium sp. ORS 278]